MRRDDETRVSNGGATIIFAVFATVCVAAFLAYRGSDVGQLPKLVENLGGGPLFGTGIVDSLVGIVVALLIGISWLGVGSIVTRFVKRERHPSRGLDAVFATAVGAGIWSLIWFFLGLTGLYSPAVAIVAVVAGLALAALSFGQYRQKSEGTTSEKKALFDSALIGLIALPLILAFISSLAPPVAKDTLLYHFAVPRAFIAQHSNAFIDGNIASYLSLGTEMHDVWAMLLGGLLSPRAAEAAAGVTTFLFFPLLLIAIYGWAREIGVSRRWGLIATAMFASIPTTYYVASTGYIDLSLALFVTLAIYALTHWWKEQTTGWVILIAIFLGAALAVKLTAVFVFAAFALIVLLRARNPVAIAPGSDRAATNPGRIVLSGFAALLLAGAIASPWYLRTWRATGSPVFPFYMNIIKGEANGWDVERSNLFQAMNSQYGGEQKNALDYLVAPVSISVKAQPEDARYFDGVLGVAFLIGLPILIWALWKFELPVEVKIGSGVAALMFLFWLFSSQQLRYLLPILPVLAIGIAASAEAIAARRAPLYLVWKYSLVVASLAGILTTVAWFLQKAPLRVALGGETRDQYLTRNLDYYPYYQTLNADAAPDAKIWLINMRRDTYNIERPVFSDYLFEDWTLKKMLWESRSVQELKAKTAAMGIKYVLTRHDFLFDFDKSTLVDDKKPRAENDAKLKIVKDFILDPANTVRSDNKFSLIKVF